MLDKRMTYVTPVYNGSRFIEEVVLSVAEQRTPDGKSFRHIVVNDGSTDDTQQILEQLKLRLGPHLEIINKENGGEASAVNSGVAEVETPFVCVVNADDPLLSGHGTAMASALEQHPHIAVVYPDWQMIDEDGARILTRTTKPFDERALIGDFVCLPGPGAAIRIADALGDLRNPKYRYITDLELWIRLAGRKEFLRVPHVLATWRQHNEGATATGGGAKIADELLRLAENDLQRLLPEQSYQRHQRSARAHAMYYAALQIVGEHPSRARRLMMRSVLLKPLPSIGYPTHHRNPVGVVLSMCGRPGHVALKKLSAWRAQLAGRRG